MAKKIKLNFPQLLFIIGTRAALGAGVALLASRRMSDAARRKAGTTLALIGAVSTIPAARFAALGRRSLMQRAAAVLR
jgi:hypothetical protein